MVKIKGSVFSHRCSLATFYFSGNEKMSWGQFHNQKMQCFVNAQGSLINVINTAVIIIILYSRIHIGQRLQSSGTFKFVCIFSSIFNMGKGYEFPLQFFYMRKINGRVTYLQVRNFHEFIYQVQVRCLRDRLLFL